MLSQTSYISFNEAKTHSRIVSEFTISPTAVDLLVTLCQWVKLKEWREILVIFSKVKESSRILVSSDI
jgi:hypothetical protein